MLEMKSTFHPLEDLNAKTDELVKEAKQSGQPVILTVNGEADMVLQDAASYQRLIEELDRAQAIAGIKEGLESMYRGEGRPARKALEEFASEHGIQLQD
jgi:prevent-host-death family protein